MNTSNQGVQIAAIIGIVVIVLALIAAKVFAPQESGINDLLTLIGGVVTVLLGLAKLQSIGNTVTQVSNKTDATAAKVDTISSKTDDNLTKLSDVSTKLDATHSAVSNFNQTMLNNQASVSDAAGFSRGVTESAKIATAMSGAVNTNKE